MVAKDHFFGEGEQGMFYVGFIKSRQGWMPLSMVSDPQGRKQLDSLFMSRSCQLMTETVKSYADRISQVEETFVQYLMPVEIMNLMERYGLEQVAMIDSEENSDAVCGCGCGCQ
jgi:hypothetical protein